MQLLVIIAYISTFVWLIPPFKQYKSKYFIFFLVIAISEVVSIILWKVFHIKPQIISAFTTLFLIYSLLTVSYKRTIITICIALVLIALNLKLIDKHIYIFISLMNVFILVVVINHFLMYALEKNAISLFLVFLISYELSAVLKNIVFVTDIMHGITLFSVTTFFQIFFGIIFSFVNVNTKVFPITKRSIVD